MTQEELDLILKQHKLWLESAGEKGEQANFSRTILEAKFPQAPQGAFRILFHEGGGMAASQGVHYTNGVEDPRQRITYFTGLTFSGSNLSQAIFGDVILYDCDMDKVNLSACDLSCAKFVKVKLNNVHFGGFMAPAAKLAGSHFDSCELNNCFMQHFNLTNCMFIRSSLNNSNFHNADFSNSCLASTSFELATLDEAKLISCNLDRANLTSANLTKADLSQSSLYLTNLSNAKIDGVIYTMNGLLQRLKGSTSSGKSKQHFVGCRIESAYGNEQLKKALKEEAFVEEFACSHPKLYKLWLVSSDCGRSIKLWLFWSLLTVNVFATIYFSLGENGFSFAEKIVPLAEQGSYFLYVYYSIVTFTTLGFGDITPITTWAMFIVVCEVTIGFIMLGLLISILANKVASRS